jgi:GxxExxY protein
MGEAVHASSRNHPPMRPIPPMEDFDERTYAIIGAAQEVHSVLGCGYLERVYGFALGCEMRRRDIPFEVEVELPISYKGDVMPGAYRIDFLCFGEVLVELKALSTTGSIEEAQVLNYLKASSLETALLLNFGSLRLESRRFALSWRRQVHASASSAPSADGQFAPV